MSKIIKLASLSDYQHFLHAISTKEAGSFKKEDLSIHHANLIKFGKAAGIPAIIVCMKQVHSGNVAVVESTRELELPDTDAMITNKKNLGLAVITADCLPVLFYDPVRGVTAVAHAGSKGLLNGILHNTIVKMKEVYDCLPEDIVVGIGPYIRANCYEVGGDYAQKFHEAFPDCDQMIRKENGKHFLSLKQVALHCLKKEGILKSHIEVSPSCTKCEDELCYSYRRGDKTGRFVSVVCLQ